MSNLEEKIRSYDEDLSFESWTQAFQRWSAEVEKAMLDDAPSPRLKLKAALRLERAGSFLAQRAFRDENGLKDLSKGIWMQYLGRFSKYGPLSTADNLIGIFPIGHSLFCGAVFWGLTKQAEYWGQALVCRGDDEDGPSGAKTYHTIDTLTEFYFSKLHQSGAPYELSAADWGGKELLEIIDYWDEPSKLESTVEKALNEFYLQGEREGDLYFLHPFDIFPTHLVVINTIRSFEGKPSVKAIDRLLQSSQLAAFSRRLFPFKDYPFLVRFADWAGVDSDLFV